MERLAGYLGAVESGYAFGDFAGDSGVGTFGGSEDHTAILCARPNALVQYSFCPVRFEREVPLPRDHELVIASSGVVAEKIGAVRERYNELSRSTQRIAERWRAISGRNDATLGDLLASAPDAIERTMKALDVPLRDRFTQFVLESTELIPAAGDALAAGDLVRLGQIVDRSQDAAERLLRNQIPETMWLVRDARARGAVAASAFGAGFGGSVWALVPADRAESFRETWAEEYARHFPGPAAASMFFTTRAGSPAIEALMISRREFLDRIRRFALGAAAVRLPGPGRELTLSNESIAATWTIADNTIKPSTLTNRLRGANLPVSVELFTLNAPTPIPASAFRIVGDPRVSRSEVSATLRDPDGKLEVVWRATLRDDAKYLRQELSMRALKGDVALREISLFDFNAPKTRVTGTVRGSPIVVDGDTYFAFEHPLANNGVEENRVRCRMARTLPLRSGIDAGGELRRGCDADRSVAARFPGVHRARAGAPVSNVPALQHVVQHRLLNEIRRSRCAGGGERVRNGVAREAWRHARFVPLRRRVGRAHHIVALPFGIPERLHRAPRRDAKVRCGPGRVDVPVGRVQQTARATPRVWKNAALRDERARIRAFGTGLLQALSRHVHGNGTPVRRESASSSTEPETRRVRRQGVRSTAISTRRFT